MRKRNATATPHMVGYNPPAAPIRPAWHGRAFLVEALILLALLIGSLAVVMNVCAKAYDEGSQGVRTTQAVQLAQNTAEEFAANPASMMESDSSGANAQTNADAQQNADADTSNEETLTAQVQVTPEHYEAGTLYKATITICDEAGSVIYSLDTARYVANNAGESDNGTGGSEVSR